jgi:hypothetical protein
MDSRSARIPIIVIMQLLRAAQTKSVGLNASPLPLLSGGASVITTLPDLVCTASVLNPAIYFAVIGAIRINFLNIFCVANLSPKFISKIVDKDGEVQNVFFIRSVELGVYSRACSNAGQL